MVARKTNPGNKNGGSKVSTQPVHLEDELEDEFVNDMDDSPSPTTRSIKVAGKGNESVSLYDSNNGDDDSNSLIQQKEKQQRLRKIKNVNVNHKACEHLVTRGDINYVNITLNRQEYLYLSQVLKKADINIAEQYESVMKGY